MQLQHPLERSPSCTNRELHAKSRSGARPALRYIAPVNGRGIAQATGVAVLMAAVGVGGGYAYADLRASEPNGAGAGTPAAASEPSYPSTPQDQNLVPDSGDPPLAEDVELVTATLGKPGRGITLSVPKGWIRVNQPGGTEARWSAPPLSDSPYSVRVALVQVRQSPLQMVAAKLAQLPFDSRIRDLEVKDRDEQQSVFTYIINNHKIEQVDRFVSLTNGPADVEIATSGRQVDEPGMLALVQRMADSAELLPAAQKSDQTQAAQ